MNDPAYTFEHVRTAPVELPSGSSRKDSQAQPQTLPRHSSRSADHGRRQPIQAVVSPISWRQNTQVRLDLSQEFREALLVRSVCRVRLRPDILGVAIVELVLLLVGDLDHTDRCDCGTGLVGQLGSCADLGLVSPTRHNQYLADVTQENVRKTEKKC